MKALSKREDRRTLGDAIRLKLKVAIKYEIVISVAVRYQVIFTVKAQGGFKAYTVKHVSY